MVERLKVAAAIIKETFTHPLSTSFITVDNGNVLVTRVEGTQEQEESRSAQ
jgi:hypothetical protein